MPPRPRRSGAIRGALSSEVKLALRAEAERLGHIEGDLETIKAVGDAFAARDAELERIAKVRLRAVQRLRRQG